MRLALDHLTIVDSDPLQLAKAARDTGCRGICLFLESMDILPAMPPFSLVRDLGLRRELSHMLEDGVVEIDIAYPFTLSGKTQLSSLEAQLECAAALGARAVNVLVYDRESARRLETFSDFCELASSYGLAVALEFYPVSAVPSLAAAVSLVRAVGRGRTVGVNVDILHLMRSGGAIREMDAAARAFIVYGQICDGPLACRPEDLGYEASSNRLLPGAGSFDVQAFVDALPQGCPISVEAPQTSRIASLPRGRRASNAVEAAMRSLRRA